VVRVVRSDSQPLVRGLAAQTRIAGAEPAGDTLRLHTLGGDDRVTVSDVFNLITTVVDLGADE
jgi:hypothetical protein